LNAGTTAWKENCTVALLSRQIESTTHNRVEVR
jgi:hypothetical protein